MSPVIISTYIIYSLELQYNIVNNININSKYKLFGAVIIKDKMIVLKKDGEVTGADSMAGCC